MTDRVAKVGQLATITPVAEDLGEEDWLWDIAIGMEIEDGVILVCGVGEDRVQAFAEFGRGNLVELKFYKPRTAEAVIPRPTPNGCSWDFARSRRTDRPRLRGRQPDNK